jgi:hypothetical protein
LKLSFRKKISGGLAMLLIVALLLPVLVVAAPQKTPNLDIRNVQFTVNGLTADVFGTDFESLPEVNLSVYSYADESLLGSDTRTPAVTSSVYSASFSIPIDWDTLAEPKTITLYAYNEDESISRELTLNYVPPVITPSLTEVRFVPGSYSVAVGKTVSASVYAVYSDSSSVNVTSSAGLVSSHPTVASVDAGTGVISGLGVGTTVITAAYGGESATATVTVTVAADSDDGDDGDDGDGGNPGEDDEETPPTKPSGSDNTGRSTADAKAVNGVLKPDSEGNIDEAALWEALSQRDTVTVELPGDRVTLPLGLYLAGAQALKGKTLIIQTPNGKFILEGANLIQAVSALQIFGGSAMSRARAALSLSIEKNETQDNAYAGVNYSARIKVSGAGILTDTQDVPLSAVYQVGKTLPPRERVNADQTAAFRIDPATKKPIFAPALLSQTDAQLTATIRLRAPGSYFLVHRAAEPFKDAENHPAQEDIQVLKNKYILSGRTDNSFAPNSNLTRDEVAQLLVNALGLSGTGKNPQPSSFADVSNTDWAAGAVNLAKQAGLLNGYSDGTFRGGSPVYLGEFAVILWRALQYTGKADPADPNREPTPADALQDLVDSGILMPPGNHSLDAFTEVPRGEAAGMIRRFLQKIDYIN